MRSAREGVKVAYVNRTVRSGNLDVDGLLMDYQWVRGSNLFFGFPVSRSQWTGYTPFNGTDNEPITSIGLNSRQQIVATAALRQIEGLVEGLSFSRAPAEADADGRADIRFGTTNEIETAQAYTPYAASTVNGQSTAGDVAGDVWFSYRYGDYENPVAGDYAYYTFLHEIGHAVGLNHPHDGEVYGTVSAKYDNMNYTVMTYRSYEGMGIEAPFHNEDFGYPQTYMLLDIAALQFMYGADFTFNAGNTTYTWSPFGGEFYINGTLTLDPGANKIFMTLWDGGGIDTYSFWQYNTAVKVDLEPGAWTITTAQQRVNLGDGHSADGNIANAWLYQGDTRSLIENAEGGSGDDILMGNQAANTLRGSEGNDTLDGRTGADLMIGGNGNDIYYIDNAGDEAWEPVGYGDFDKVFVSLATYRLNDNVELMTGTAAMSQTLTGNASNNTIEAVSNWGHRLDGGAGADILRGGQGNDIFVIDNAGDQVFGGGGTDTIESSISYTLTYTASNGAGTLILTGTAAINGTGHEYLNSLVGNDAANILDGGAGDDWLEGRGGDDTYIVDAGDRVLEAVNGGTDRVIASVNHTLAANVENLTLTGSAYAGTGNALDNEILGNAAANRIDGGAGADRMVGGAGGDSYFVDNAGDVIVEDTSDASTDFVTSSISYTLGAGLETLILVGNAALNGTGNAAANALIGNDGANTLDGREGADQMSGGAGNDLYIVDNVGDTAEEAFGNGLDTVLSSVSFTLGFAVENLTLTGTAAINGTGNGDANLLIGNSAANRLDGGIGNDEMRGGLGDDVYDVREIGDQVVELAGGGTDTVTIWYLSGAIYTMAANVENANIMFDDDIVGNALANTITGALGNNVIDGGAGADRMAGGAGGDTYYVDQAGDVVEEVNDPNDLPDTVIAAISYTLGNYVERLTLAGSAVSGTGNALDNVIEGNALANRIEGKGGADRLSGGGGADTFVYAAFGDSTSSALDRITDFQVGSDKIDLVGLGRISVSFAQATDSTTGQVYTIVTAAASANTLVLRVDGIVSRADVLTDTPAGTSGNDVLIGSDNPDELNGEGGDDILQGLGGNDILIGGDGQDRLEGGLGQDRMTGGAGDDLYLVDDAGDTVVEAIGGGTDTIQAAISLALPDNVENLTLLFPGVNGTGNGLANRLIGNSTNNVLDGGAGADYMDGGAGDDVYLVDDAGDVVVEAVGGGTDTIQSTSSLALPDNVENLTLLGFAANGTGNGLANRIIGNSTTNVLDGGAGADFMDGGGASDTYYVDNVGDQVADSGGDFDLVYSSVSFAISDGIEYLWLTGSAPIDGTGNAQSNWIGGNDGANVLDGGGSADTLRGGLGDDRYIVDDAGDVVVEAVGGGTDTIQTTISLALPDNVENLTLLLSGANGTGNGLANRLIGNSTNNVLDGGAGADYMDGGGADDIYYVDNVGDQVVDSSGDFDQVFSSVSFTISDGIEYLWLTGSAPINGTGNAQSNRIMGNDGANVLDGGGNADTLDGGLGDDRYIVDHPNDTAAEQPGGGTDTVVSSIGWTLYIETENLILTGLGTGIGSQKDNVIEASSLGNRLEGLDGDDTLKGGAAADTLLGGNGLDSITGGGGDDVLTGGADADTLDGGAGADRFMYLSFSDSSVAARDRITGFQSGVDKIDLLALGRVTIVFSQASDAGTAFTIVEARSANGTLTLRIDGVVGMGDLLFDNALFGTAESERIDGTEADDEIRGFGGWDELYGHGGNDLIVGGDNNDVLDGGTGRDTMRGGGGDDFYYVDQADDVVEELAGGGDHDLVFTTLASYTLGAELERLFGTAATGQILTGNAVANHLYAGSGNDTTYGLGGSDQIEGNGGNDTLYGGDGQDGLWGNDGNDVIEGGAGQDSLIGGAGDDILRGEHGDQFFGNDGNDIVELRGGTGLADTPKSLGYLGTGFDRITFDYSGFTEGVNFFASAGASRLEASLYIDVGSGGLGKDIARFYEVDQVSITTGSGNDYIEARGPGDTINTGAGNDLISMGGAGSSWNFIGALKVDAGTGTDTVRINWSDLGAGQAVIWDRADAAGVTIGSGDSQRTLLGVEILEHFQSGAGDDRFTMRAAGSSILQTVYSNAGNDSVTVIAGATQALTGRFYLDLGAGAGDALVLDFSASTQAISNRTVAYTMGGSHLLLAYNYEKLTVTGSGLGDVLLGAEGATDTRLSGGGGDDVLGAGAGVTVADGGTGSDRLEVNFGTSNANQSLIVAATTGAGGGYDGSLSGSGGSASYTSIEHFTISAGYGQDVIVTRGGNDVLDGGSGADKLTGGAGNDVYILDSSSDEVFELAGEGDDEIRVYLTTYTLGETSNVERLTTIYGGGSVLIGNSLNNVLTGGFGNDTLAGGAGADTMRGGNGDDSYFATDAGDVAEELAGEGTDRVYASVASFTLGANIEQLFSYAAASGQALTGNALANLIVGSGYGDTLDGAGGADWLTGGNGDDIYIVDDAGDVVEEQAGQGTDEVRTALAAYTLTAANVERLVGISTVAGQALTGNAAANTIVGTSFGDVLDGGAGNDVLQGGLGNDAYVIDSFGDVVTENAGEGVDEIRTALGSRTDFSQMYTLAANVENLTGTSATGQGVFGNALNNVVNMGVGGDLVALDSGGNDIVSGGGGDDFLYWGSAFNNADRADGGAGFDTVGLIGSYSFTFDADDLVSVEKLAFYSSGNAAAPNSYSFTMNDGNVAAGQQMMIVGQSLLATEAFTFNGAAETNGSFNVRGGRGADTITGGAKGDVIWGALGADTLKGGAGNDVFEYLSTSESTASSADVILDFARGDKINLSGIDADGNAANGDTKFTWLGEGAFTGQAGQLRVSHHPQYATTWVVEADVDGDSIADLTIYFVAPAGFLPEKNDFYV